MGFAIAETLANMGAKITLIAGPVALSTSHRNIERVDVLSAEEMFEQAKKRFPETDGAIMSAAVADYKVKHSADKKIKRQEGTSLQIELSPNPDIAKYLGKIKQDNQLLIGFALETNNEFGNAYKKLIKKNLDFIVLNSLNDKGAGFGHNTNKITIIDKHNNIDKFELKSKKEVSLDIANKIVELT